MSPIGPEPLPDSTAAPASPGDEMTPAPRAAAAPEGGGPPDRSPPPRPPEREPGPDGAGEEPDGACDDRSPGGGEPEDAPEGPGDGDDGSATEEDREEGDAPDRGPGTGSTQEPEGGAPPPRRSRTPRAFAPVPPERLEGAIEALLLAAGDVLSAERLRDLLALPSVIPVREAVAAVGERWARLGLAVEVQEIAGGWRATTRPDYAEYVGRLARRPATDRLSPSLLETLSIVAYRQPVTRVEVERIRGVQAGEALRALLERHLAKVVGRSDQPGRPLLYGTTRRFLEVFGLGSLKDLPKKGDLQSL